MWWTPARVSKIGPRHRPKHLPDFVLMLLSIQFLALSQMEHAPELASTNGHYLIGCLDVDPYLGGQSIYLEGYQLCMPASLRDRQ